MLTNYACLYTHIAWNIDITENHQSQKNVYNIWIRIKMIYMYILYTWLGFGSLSFQSCVKSPESMGLNGKCTTEGLIL